jgi:hypothetical protein
MLKFLQDLKLINLVEKNCGKDGGHQIHKFEDVFILLSFE